MKTFLTASRRILPLLVAVIATTSSGLLAQEKEAEIKKRIAARLPTIRTLKSQGKLGETWLGALGPPKDSYLKESVTIRTVKPRKLTIATLIEEENKDRNAIYAILAKRRSTEKQKVTAEYVGQQSAKDLLKRAKPGDWLLTKKGKWIQKPKR